MTGGRLTLSQDRTKTEHTSVDLLRCALYTVAHAEAVGGWGYLCFHVLAHMHMCEYSAVP